MSADGKTGKGIYPDGMVEHDGHVGLLLKKLDDLGIADNTIVVYTSDNGAEVMTWPDGGNTPFRGEKATNWEGGYRVPTLIKWPGVINLGTIYNEAFSHCDLIPTFCAAGGEPDVVNKCHRRRKDLQGSSRWLQPDAALLGECGRLAAPRLPLLERRRRTCRRARSGLEGCLQVAGS
jgi:arylsulfatase A-like enzyme